MPPFARGFSSRVCTATGSPWAAKAGIAGRASGLQKTAKNGGDAHLCKAFQPTAAPLRRSSTSLFASDIPFAHLTMFSTNADRKSKVRFARTFSRS